MARNRNNRKIGSLYEEKAAEFLKEKGLRIIARNFHCKTGEIDIIARDGRYLVFVEVKYRRTMNCGDALCAVDPKKQWVISRVAEVYLLSSGYAFESPCRFDVVGFDGDEILWIKNAFDFCA